MRISIERPSPGAADPTAGASMRIADGVASLAACASGSSTIGGNGVAPISSATPTSTTRSPLRPAGTTLR